MPLLLTLPLTLKGKICNSTHTAFNPLRPDWTLQRESDKWKNLLRQPSVISDKVLVLLFFLPNNERSICELVPLPVNSQGAQVNYLQTGFSL